MLQPLVPSASAVSTEADYLYQSALQVENRVESSQALFGAKSKLLSALQELARECGDDDWDGYGARAVSPASLAQAQIFIRALPDRLPLPELSAEPDGAIALDWMPDKQKTLSVSVSARPRLTWASVDGTERNRGAVPFTGVMPSRIVSEIERISGHGTSFRAA